MKSATPHRDLIPHFLSSTSRLLALHGHAVYNLGQLINGSQELDTFLARTPPYSTGLVVFFMGTAEPSLLESRGTGSEESAAGREPGMVPLDSVNRLMDACQQAFPAMKSVAVLMEGPQRMLGATGGHAALGVLQLQAWLGTALVSSVKDLEQYRFVDFRIQASQWPELTSQAVRLGFTAVHVLPLAAWGVPVGIVSMFAEEARALTAEQVRVAQEITALTPTNHFIGSDAQ